MVMKRSLTATYVILGRAHLAADPYDARSTFVLLNSIVEGLGETAPGVIDLVCHLHMVAALGNNGVANREAHIAIARLVDHLESRLAQEHIAG